MRIVGGSQSLGLTGFSGLGFRVLGYVGCNGGQLRGLGVQVFQA